MTVIGGKTVTGPNRPATSQWTCPTYIFTGLQDIAPLLMSNPDNTLNSRRTFRFQRTKSLKEYDSTFILLIELAKDHYRCIVILSLAFCYLWPLDWCQFSTCYFKFASQRSRLWRNFGLLFMSHKNKVHLQDSILIVHFCMLMFLAMLLLMKIAISPIQVYKMCTDLWQKLSSLLHEDNLLQFIGQVMH